MRVLSLSTHILAGWAHPITSSNQGQRPRLSHLVITTGTFTPAAKAEATRDGAPPVDLVGGDELCDLLKEFGLGVEVEKRTVEDINVEVGFFDAI